MNAVVLPAHAQTSMCITDTMVGGPLAGNPSGATTCQAACEAEAAAQNAQLCNVTETVDAMGATQCGCDLDLPQPIVDRLLIWICLFHITFLEDSTIYTYSRKQLLETFGQSSKWEQFGRYMSESAYVKIMQQVYDTKFYSLEERYLQLIEDRTELFQRVPLYLIASYLNTTPETISRIRRSLSNSAQSST